MDNDSRTLELNLCGGEVKVCYECQVSAMSAHVLPKN